jgi:hypothetical protein
MTTAPQRTWTLLDARWRPRLVPSLVQQWLGAGAVQTLVGRDIIEGRGDTAGHATAGARPTCSTCGWPRPRPPTSWTSRTGLRPQC